MPRHKPFLSRGAQLLYNYRIKHKLTQRELAKTLAVDHGEVSLLERGKLTPNLRVAVALELITRGGIPCGSWLIPLGIYAKSLKESALLKTVSEILD